MPRALRVVLSLCALLVLAVPATASARKLTDRATGFSVRAPRDFRLHADRSHKDYRITSRRRHAEVRFRIVTRRGVSTRARMARAAARRVALARFRGRGLHRPRTVHVLRQIAQSSSVRAVILPGRARSAPITLRWTSPTGTRLSGTAQLEAVASDPSRVRQVVFSVDGVRKTIELYAPYQATVDTTGLRNGVHAITATATQTDGRNVTIGKWVTVANSTTSPAPVSSGAASAWDANFDAARSSCGFDQAGWNPYTSGGDYPDCPTSVGIAPASSEGVPAPPTGQRDVAHFEVTAADARAAQPRYHAKLYKTFFAPGYGESQKGQHDTRPPADVSGTYTAWYYMPSNYRISGTGWRNIFQFKERYWDGHDSGYVSDPLYWLVLYNGDGNGTPYATVNYWNGGNAGSVGREVAFPRNRWVQVKAVIRQGQSIQFYLDGELIATGQNSTYPVAPFHGRLSLGWNFGVGDYAGAGDSGAWQDRVSNAPLYIGGASYRG